MTLTIFNLIILVLLILSFFVFKFALQKEKIYSPKIIDNQIFTDFEVIDLIEEKKINFDKILIGKNFYLISSLLLQKYVPVIILVLFQCF